jgi:hypothetical protein
LKPEMRREPNVEYDDVREVNRAGKDTNVAWMQERLGTPLTPLMRFVEMRQRDEA